MEDLSKKIYSKSNRKRYRLVRKLIPGAMERDYGNSVAIFGTVGGQYIHTAYSTTTPYALSHIIGLQVVKPYQLMYYLKNCASGKIEPVYYRLTFDLHKVY